MGFGDTGQILLVLLLSVGAVALIFFVLRAFVLWYWKIDRIVELLEELVSLTRGSAPAVGARAVPQTTGASAVSDMDGAPPRTLSQAEFKTLSLPQQVAAMDYGRLLSREDANKMSQLLGNLRDADARTFAASHGEQVVVAK